MTREEYNRSVQDMQEFCDASGVKHRVRPEYKDGKVVRTVFEVYFDHWRILGDEAGEFGTNDREYTFWENPALKLKSKIAASIAKS